MATRYYDTKTLPKRIAEVLQDMGVGRESIRCDESTAYTEHSPGGTGRRGFCAVVDLRAPAGVVHTHLSIGAWGGPNPFMGGNGPVDVPGESKPLQPGVAVVKGETGFRPFAYIVAHPDTIEADLPELAPAIELTSEQAIALDVMCSLNSRGRAEWWPRHGWSDSRVSAALDSLSALGLVKRARNGATKVTPKGHEARERSGVRCGY